MAKTFTHNDTTINVGDTVRVQQEVREDEGKTRIQNFEGIVIAVKGRGNGQSFTVRRMGVAGIGVEKIFPVRLPNIKKIDVTRRGDVRRAKLYYLRDRLGKAATKVKEKSQFAQPRK